LARTIATDANQLTIAANGIVQRRFVVRMQDTIDSRQPASKEFSPDHRSSPRLYGIHVGSVVLPGQPNRTCT